MKRMTKVLSLLLVFVVLGGCTSGWGEKSTIHEDGWYSFWITSERQITFTNPNEQSVVTYVIKPRDIPINMESTDVSVATIDEYGVVTAIGPGTCEIRFEVGTLDIGLRETSIHVICDF